jgi:prophage tail gpP-like protein
VFLGNDLVITGYVDRVTPSIAPGTHSVQVVGRGKCQDLVDCSAEWPSGQMMVGNALGIAQGLAAPYGITVTSTGPAGPTIPQFNIMLTDTPHEIIQRVCTFAQLLAYDTPDGNLLLSQVGTVAAASGFREGTNVLHAQIQYSMDQRFQTYVIFRMALDVIKDLGPGGNLIQVAQDAGVLRHRRKYFIADSAGGEIGVDVGVRRITWEMNRRAGRGCQVHITTDSWRDSAGVLYTPNTLVDLHLPSLKLQDERWVISEVIYRRGMTGTQCDLVIMTADSFAPEPRVFLPFFADVPSTPTAAGWRP